jgi:hypothetical protein
MFFNIRLTILCYDFSSFLAYSSLLYLFKMEKYSGLISGGARKFIKPEQNLNFVLKNHSFKQNISILP